MDFGAAVGFDGLLGSDPDAKLKPYGSSFFKQLDRPSFENADDWRAMDSANKAKLARLSDECFSSTTQNMLCFSTPSPVSSVHKTEYPYSALPCLSYTPSVYSNYTGLSYGGINGGNVLGGGRGPFTPSQWMELEHQALIYKYINANVPVPSNLLIPIRKALESAGFCYAAGLLRPSSLGWGSFQLGFTGSTDPEPGRCRRTDGKKWRCSRDAVADQKYCERHMNRGRHRSRKPVEGLSSGYPVSGGGLTAATTSATGNKPQGLSAGSVVAGGGFQSGVLSLSAESSLNRFFMNKDGATEKIQIASSGFSLTSPSRDLKSKAATPFMIESSLNQTPEPNHASIRQFMDSTHLSISVPMASEDSKMIFSPLRSDPVQMNLGVGVGEPVSTEPGYNETVHERQTMNWIPISWETSMGGPLGEVLHSHGSIEGKNSSVLNLMTEGWESGSSSPLGSSPTGVLQKATFGSVSNSSAGSSPRADENRPKPLEGATAGFGEV